MINDCSDVGMRDGHAHAYYCDTRPLDAIHVAAALRLLSSDERERHDRLAGACDRRDYVAAHALLRVALGAHTKTAPEQLMFAPGAHGKPFLVAPDPDAARPDFSLAHSRDLVGCVMASGRAVGMDVEAVEAATRTSEIAHRFFSVDEAAALQRYSVDEQPGRFCELWTLKEALLKAEGTGFACPLDCVSFRVRGRYIRVTHRPPLAAKRWALLLMNVGDRHKLAVAVGNTTGGRSRIRVAKLDSLAISRAVLAAVAPEHVLRATVHVAQ